MELINKMNPVSVNILKGVGTRCAEMLANLHILSVQDLLCHLPARYEDRSRIYKIAEIKNGDRVLIEGEIETVQIVGARRYLKCVLRDGSRFIDLIFYYFVPGHQKKISALRGKIRCFGEVRYGFSGHLEMVHPEYAAINLISENSVLTLSPCLLPVYPTTKGLQQNTLRKLMQQALVLLKQDSVFPELLPESILKKNNFYPLTDALQYIHFPPMNTRIDELMEAKHPAVQRLMNQKHCNVRLRKKQRNISKKTCRRCVLV